jgi:hypothetical protein
MKMPLVSVELVGFKVHVSTESCFAGAVVEYTAELG